MTYVALSAVFLAAAALVLVVALATTPDRAPLLRRWGPVVLVAGAALLVLTIVFDNVMIAVGLIRYGETAISGAKIGLMPVEDLCYPVAGLLLLPAVWLLTRRRAR